MKKTAAALLCSTMALTMAGCSSNGGETGTQDTATEKPQEILVGISPDYPPYESKDASGQLTGFDIEMTDWLFNWLNENGHNYSYEWVELDFDTIISALQAGQIDLGISGFTEDKDREGIFSDPYYNSAQVIVVHSNSDISSTADLNGKTVGAQQGATGEKAAGEIEGATVQAGTDINVLMETLKADGLDAVVLDEAVAKNFAKNGDFKVLDEKLMEEQNVIYTTEANQELMDQINEAIAAFLKSDEFETLSQKYFAE